MKLVLVIALTLLVTPAAAQTIAVDGSLVFDGTTLGLRSGPPLGPILDANIVAGAYSSGHAACMADSNCQIAGDTLQLISRNDQVQPGSIGIGGTWTVGDTAAITFDWTGHSETISCVVGSSCNGPWGGGTGANVIAGSLRDQAWNNQTLYNSPFYSGAVFPNYPLAGEFGWPYLTTYHEAFEDMAITNVSHTAHGKVTGSRFEPHAADE